MGNSNVKSFEVMVSHIVGAGPVSMTICVTCDYSV